MEPQAEVDVPKSVPHVSENMDTNIRDMIELFQLIWNFMPEKNCLQGKVATLYRTNCHTTEERESGYLQYG